jgi:hypothetical protein
MTTRGLQTLVSFVSLCLLYHDNCRSQYNSFIVRKLLHFIPNLYSYVHKEPIMSDASLIVSKVHELGMQLSVSGCVATVQKTFTPNDKIAYCNAESDAYTILGMIKRTTSGSIWGTDSGSIGGHVGLTGGYVSMHKSGCSKNLLKQIAKLL